MHEASAPALDPKLLEHVGDLNRRLLELLVATAAGQATGLVTPVVSDLRSHWQQLSTAALQRLANCPYLLLDLTVTELTLESSAAGRIREPALLAGRTAGADSPGPLRELRWRALLTAWHFAHTNPLAARISLGMTSADCTVLASMPLATLETASTQQGWHLCIRFEDRVDIWQQLLLAAADQQSRRLRQLQLRGLQLLAGQLLPGIARQGDGRSGPLC
jgi:hypothetical protein